MDTEKLQQIVKGIREQRHLNAEVSDKSYSPPKTQEPNDVRKRIEEIELQQKLANDEEIGYLLTEPSYGSEERKANARKGKMQFLKSQSQFEVAGTAKQS